MTAITNGRVDVVDDIEAAAQAAESEYITVAQAIERAPDDLKETDVDGVFGGKVRIRALTAAQSAIVKQASIKLGGPNGGDTEFSFAASELLQFVYGVIKPRFTKDEVRTLHTTAGPSFQKVIEALDKLSGTKKEDLRKAQEEFPGPVDD